MKVLSLFDGISCAYEGLKRAGIDVKEYYACEIDKHAIKVSQSRHPDIIRPVNDVRELIGTMLPEIDLLIGGSPCQDLSIAKKNRKGLDGDRSGLFWEYVRILKEVKPKYFVLENVASMPKADKDLITETLGVEPVLFNASLVSAQTRKRLFWTNISFTLPEDKGIVLKDILQPDVDKCFFLKKEMNVREKKQLKEDTDKSISLTASMYKGSQNNGMTLVKVGYIGEGYDVKGEFHKTAQTGRNETKKLGYVGDKDHEQGKLPALNVVCNSMVKVGYIGEGEQYNRIRKLTPIECERLQGLPDDYTAGISNTQRYKCLGNAFNVDVVATIFDGII